LKKLAGLLRVWKKEMEKRDDWKILCSVVIIVLILLICFFGLRSYEKYRIMEEHKNYLEGSDVKIECWMPVAVVLDNFDIPEEVLFRELNITGGFSDRKLKIEKICEKKGLDCKMIVDNLNFLKDV